jgi:hypothetical protein
MRISEPFVAELDAEAATTRRVLERVPAAHLAWRPHPKSSTLGELALHVATLPGMLTEFLTGDRLDFLTTDTRQRMPASHAEVLEESAKSTAAARRYLADLDDDRAQQLWRMVAGDKVLLAAPRAAVIRGFLFNRRQSSKTAYYVELNVMCVVT